jgi:hypothetical protein
MGRMSDELRQKTMEGWETAKRRSSPVVPQTESDGVGVAIGATIIRLEIGRDHK